jgi:hypothetical protein
MLKHLTLLRRLNSIVYTLAPSWDGPPLLLDTAVLADRTENDTIEPAVQSKVADISIAEHHVAWVDKQPELYVILSDMDGNRAFQLQHPVQDID